MQRSLARDRLGVRQIMSITVTGAAPLTVTAGAFTTAWAVTGITGIPVAVLAVGVVLAVFAGPYVAMARRIPHAGAFYAYTTAGLGKPVGVATAAVALATYSVLQIGLYGGLGVMGADFFHTHTGWTASWWAYALAAWALVAVVGARKVEFFGRVLTVLLVAEVAVLAVFTVAFLTDPGPEGVSFATLSPANLTGSGLGVLAVMALLACSGFEQGPIYVEEVKDRRRTVVRATFASLGFLAVLFTIVPWAMSVAVGPDQLLAQARAQGPALMFTLAGTRLGDGWATTGQALLLTSLLAALISFHGAVARYAYSVGREGVAPAVLGLASRRTSAPLAGSLLQSTTGLVVIVIFAVTGADPLTKLFFYGGALGGFGFLLLLAVTSVAIVRYFTLHPDAAAQESTWTARVAPAVAAVALTGMVVLAVWHFATLLGVDPHDPLRWRLPACYAVIAVVGLGWAWFLRTRRPGVYAVVGLGPAAVTQIPSPVPAPRVAYEQVSGAPVDQAGATQ